MIPATKAQPAKHPRRATRKRATLNITSLRVRDIRRLAGLRFAFATESAAAIIMVEALAQHLALLPGDPRKRIGKFIENEVKWYGIERCFDLLDKLAEAPKWWKSTDLGWHLHLTERERETCQITTIEAAGISREQRQDINLEKRKQRAAAARQAKGAKSRAEWLADHAEKPWIKAGISRATWYRQQP